MINNIHTRIQNVISQASELFMNEGNSQEEIVTKGLELCALIEQCNYSAVGWLPVKELNSNFKIQQISDYDQYATFSYLLTKTEHTTSKLKELQQTVQQLVKAIKLDSPDKALMLKSVYMATSSVLIVLNERMLELRAKVRSFDLARIK